MEQRVSIDGVRNRDRRHEMASQTTAQRRAAGTKAAATRKRNATRQTASRTRSSARRTSARATGTAPSAQATSRAAGTTVREALRTATRGADATTTRVVALARQAERPVFITVGAA